ncbi:MAG: co-chaperone GroES family protein [Chlorobi bacterium]|jgi:co-chaperonin GroES (HSP10)|nr:co-chaperone GroES family protein [Chlorobiota bacterium]
MDEHIITDKFIVIGDRLLIKPLRADMQTPSGLYLPPTVQENQKTQSGYVIKTGPGYPLPIALDADEPWKEPNERVRYIPLQAQVGDLAIFLQREAVDIEYEGERYVIVPQSAVLMLIREEF